MGLMLGLLIGGGFFILKLDDYFKELNFYKRLSLKKEDKPEEKEEDKTKEQNKQTSYKFVQGGTTTATSSKADSVKTEVKEAAADSLSRQDTTTHNETASIQNDIVVKKDELITSMQADLVNYIAVNPGNKDSLLQKVSGIRDDKNLPKQAMTIEFWRSPINYKGYKMAKNKVVLFGLTGQDDVKLYRFDDGIYMKLQQGVFKLDFTDEFKQFERINDEAILARLK